MSSGLFSQIRLAAPELQKTLCNPYRNINTAKNDVCPDDPFDTRIHLHSCFIWDKHVQWVTGLQKCYFYCCFYKSCLHVHVVKGLSKKYLFYSFNKRHGKGTLANTWESPQYYSSDRLNSGRKTVCVSSQCSETVDSCRQECFTNCWCTRMFTHSLLWGLCGMRYEKYLVSNGSPIDTRGQRWVGRSDLRTGGSRQQKTTLPDGGWTHLHSLLSVEVERTRYSSAETRVVNTPRMEEGTRWDPKFLPVFPHRLSAWPWPAAWAAVWAVCFHHLVEDPPWSARSNELAWDQDYPP